jgi:hypothetical protein
VKKGDIAPNLVVHPRKKKHNFFFQIIKKRYICALSIFLKLNLKHPHDKKSAKLKKTA